ncbi:MAG: hypothetical protein WBM55_07605 [Muriicola sp.]
MHLTKPLFFFLLICSFSANSQIKIGDNPQNIDPSSILELESTSRAFVINRVTTAQMNAIVPIEGAMVYNTDIQCLHYYDGANWLNLCEALGLTITNNPVIHADTTIAITRVDNNINIEVDSITGLQIVDRSIRAADIAGSAINGSFHIQNRSVPLIKLIPSAVPNQIIKTNAAGTDAIWANPAPSPIAFGKANGGTQLKLFGASSITGSGGIYTVTLDAARPDDNYIIQLTVSGNYIVSVFSQSTTSFIVQIQTPLGAFVPNADWHFTVFDN